MSSATLTMSDTGLTFLKNEEGVIEGLYDDPSGYCTYGIGYLVHKQHSYLLKAAGSSPTYRHTSRSSGQIPRTRRRTSTAPSASLRNSRI